MVHNLIFLKLRANGIVDIISDSMEIGQGMNTVARQIVAEAMNVTIENVRKIEVNTAYSPWTSDSFSSSATVDMGGAAITAAKNAKQTLFALAAPKLGVKPDQLETKDGKIMVKGSPDKAIAWGDAMAPNPHMMIGGGLNDPVGAPNDYDGPGKNDYATGQALGPYFRLVMHMNFMANGCEVMVNKETGEVRVTKFIAGNDVLPVNPTTCEGQIIGGGLYHGMANALYEDIYIDKGAYLSRTCLDWKMPTIQDYPKEGDTHSALVPVWGEYFGENPRIDCPFGGKGIGEGVDCAASPCLVDAIHDATGAWITGIPAATQAKVLKALGKA
jgi:CO/xanthine dehydrogenase Mo-binding subunit